MQPNTDEIYKIKYSGGGWEGGGEELSRWLQPDTGEDKRIDIVRLFLLNIIHPSDNNDQQTGQRSSVAITESEELIVIIYNPKKVSHQQPCGHSPRIVAYSRRHQKQTKHP